MLSASNDDIDRRDRDRVSSLPHLEGDISAGVWLALWWRRGIAQHIERHRTFLSGAHLVSALLRYSGAE